MGQPTRLVGGSKEVLIAHGERLTFPKVKIFWIVMDQLWLWGTSCLSASLGNPVEGDKPATHKSIKAVCQQAQQRRMQETQIRQWPD